jgi:excinuclease ABC subunit C
MKFQDWVSTGKNSYLAHFRSIDYIREASPKQLAEVSGIGPRLAQEIYDYFHPA